MKSSVAENSPLVAGGKTREPEGWSGPFCAGAMLGAFTDLLPVTLQSSSGRWSPVSQAFWTRTLRPRRLNDFLKVTWLTSQTAVVSDHHTSACLLGKPTSHSCDSPGLFLLLLSFKFWPYQPPDCLYPPGFNSFLPILHSRIFSNAHIWSSNPNTDKPFNGSGCCLSPHLTHLPKSG